MDAIGSRNGTHDVRELARQGILATHVLRVSDTDRRLLRANAVELVWPVVYDRLTRRLEISRDHHACASSIHRLEPACLDRFHDDVDAVVDDLFRHAKVPIHNLEGWVARRLTASTVDAYRRRRGRRGALQRPRLPGWLSSTLGREPRLMRLALDMLDWVGVDMPAPATVWPVASWAERRSMVVGDYDAAYRSVAQDVEIVLAAMRRRPKWYADFVERPLSRKPLPLPYAPPADSGPSDLEPWSAMRARQQDADDALLLEMAADAVAEIALRLRSGDDPRSAVVDVLKALFGPGTGAESLDRLPGDGRDVDEVVLALLADPAAIDRITSVVLDLLAPTQP
jgi:hypothetical protein